MPSSVKGASLQCAFEMFGKDNDKLLIKEMNRILAPGGKVVILPLYMHTHYCSYSTADYYGKGYSDNEGIEYLMLGSYGIPSSRKYDVKTLYGRILRVIEDEGMEYKILILRNKEKLGHSIYCHFILEITK
jgi:ubiquinone/menaquinone biosynthesis C-methylase UbiE